MQSIIGWTKPVASTFILLTLTGYASASQWHWESFGNSNYSGEIILQDAQGSAYELQRYDSTSTEPMWGASVVQSPIVVAATSTSDIDIAAYRTGLVTDKYVCPEGQDWNVSLSVTNICANGVSHDISGVRLSYEDLDETTWKPMMYVHVTGYGWMEVTNSQCGVVEAKQFCSEP
mgnify:CR=1 FL=1|tara:strand:+ start:5314 stop:5838 length:525 start_codon:yes stop_codon:yes gene_type:complete